jgi:small subunit ribosomal protein S21
MCAQHMRFLARTVLVKNNDVDVAYRALDRILRNDMVLERARRAMYYEKPYQTRKRVSLEKCRRIYNSEMARKIEFVMRTNRPTPWPR